MKFKQKQPVIQTAINNALSGGGGGTGGAIDYTELENKPSINGVTLSGNKTASDLGLISAASLFGNVVGDYTCIINRDDKIYFMGTAFAPNEYDVPHPIMFDKTANHAFFIIVIDRPVTTPTDMPNPSSYGFRIWAVAYTGTSSNASEGSGANCFSATATTNAFGTALDTAELVTDTQFASTADVYRRLGVVGGSNTDHSLRIIVVQID